ncbi:hypothetical protein SAMN05720354_105184 [Nitrosospira sp. Nsp1]|nr:hypothetical protein SAMN05720354_105184 [Nitrosospira sp. Nsp1]
MESSREGDIKFSGWILLPLMFLESYIQQDSKLQQVSRPVKLFQAGSQFAGNVMSFAGEVKTRYESP